MRIEYLLVSHPGGAKTLKDLGNEMRHPGLWGAMMAGRSRATIAARVTSCAKVGSPSFGTVPSVSNARTGSSIGLSCTSSSDKRRYLPGATSKIQAFSVCEPCIHETQSERYFGSGRRFDVSTDVCSGSGGSRRISTLLYPPAPLRLLTSSFIFSLWPEMALTYTQFSLILQHIESKRWFATPYCIDVDVRRIKSEYRP
jgi:hypothetical protein